MENERSVAKEGGSASLGRRVKVGVLGIKGIAGDLAILSAEIANLARSGSAAVARRVLTSCKGVEVSTCLGAVTTVNGCDVNVVNYAQLASIKLIRCSGWLEITY